MWIALTAVLIDARRRNLERPVAGFFLVALQRTSTAWEEI
jgi:hypothetical protein